MITFRMQKQRRENGLDHLGRIKNTLWKSFKVVPHRQGATLSEVLVALLIMAIGVISLASLFPISVLKTARANQLTVATNIRYNAESMMKLHPHIYSDPYGVDSNNDGLLYNDYDFSQSLPFLFDPQALTPRPVAMVSTVGLLPRFGGGFQVSQQRADEICAGLDTWSPLHEGAISSATGAGTTQINVVDLSGITLPNPSINQMRVHLSYNGGKRSVTRMITNVDTTANINTLFWTEDLNGNNALDLGEDINGNYALDRHGLPTLPTGFAYDSAKLEVRERRYTWMLTVRPQATAGSFVGGLDIKPTFDVSVVVYFGRGFSQQEERIYGTPAPLSAVVNVEPGSNLVMTQGDNKLDVTFPASSPPYLKRGGFIMDAENGYWYQIQNYTDLSPSSTSSTITLNRNIEKGFRLAIFPRGVVDVFPVRPQTP